MTRKRCTLILTFVVCIFCNILTAKCNTLSGDTVPVLLWGSSPELNSPPTAVNPLLRTSQSEFTQILNSKTDNSQPPVIVFVKDSLCVEDLTQHKEDLRQVTNRSLLAYLPAVESPLSVFEDFSSYNQSYDDNIDTISDGQLVIKPIISLDSISELYRNVKDSSPYLIAALTGRSCSYSRSERTKRANVDNISDTSRNIRDTYANPGLKCNDNCTVGSNNTEFIVRGERVLLYGSQLPFIKTKDMDSFKNLSTLSNCLECYSQNNIQLKLTFKETDSNMPNLVLRFDIENASSGYYSLQNITFNPNDAKSNSEVLTSKTDMAFPFNFSYHCSNAIIFSGENTSVKLPDIQLQIDATKFSDAYDCVNFTTIPIWTGIFVTVILASIMIWGLAMIIDIRTMDRFDDPKGKTITISAQE
ncbi:PREDICTED: uncharacterized protein LOC107067990 [Polistes dominula]|uniref:Uncharacterized protein LOC107067990 n=1 Tax=Polistes dominula TaxID=743375 RepID=A0ABM1IGW9_POLDO|nr:PREDICTED: uncharacterized protein LOC107067990 [Polistes dominula]